MARSEFSGQGDLVTTYFAGKSGRYNRYRPSYPAEAIRWVLGHLPPEPVVADIGAGTGIATRGFANAGARVIGIEPNGEMRAEAIAIDRENSSPSPSAIEYRDGTAEKTGLDDACVDGVVCAQSFHWFDLLSTLIEFHRITRPGGLLALLWNVRSANASEADATFERIMARARAYAESRGRVVGRAHNADLQGNPYFAETGREDFDNFVSYTHEELMGRARSASYFPDHGLQTAGLERALSECFAHYGVNGRLTLKQQCRVILARRVD